MTVSSLRSGSLVHRLTCDIGQMMLFVIRRLISPHDEDDLQPLGAEGAQGLLMGVALATLLTVIGRRPCAIAQGKEGQLVDSMTQPLVAGKPKVHHAALATALGNRYRPCLPLEVLKGLPAARSVTQLSPQARDGPRRFCHPAGCEPHQPPAWRRKNPRSPLYTLPESPP